MVTLHTENFKLLFSKYFGYYNCMTVFLMLIQRMQWTSGCKYLQWEASEFYTRAMQIQSEVMP